MVNTALFARNRSTMQATSDAFRKMMFSDEFQEVAQAASRAVFRFHDLKVPGPP